MKEDLRVTHNTLSIESWRCKLRSVAASAQNTGVGRRRHAVLLEADVI